MEGNTNTSESVETKEKGCGVFKTVVKIAIGVVFVLLGVIAVIRWWSDLAVVFKGCIGLFLVMIGFITIAIAKE